LQAFENRKFPLSLSLKNSKKPKTWFGTRWSTTWVGHAEIGDFRLFEEREKGEELLSKMLKPRGSTRKAQSVKKDGQPILPPQKQALDVSAFSEKYVKIAPAYIHHFWGKLQRERLEGTFNVE